MSLACSLRGSPGNSPPAVAQGKPHCHFGFIAVKWVWVFLLYSSDSWKPTHGSRAGMPQEAVEAVAVSSLSSSGSRELSAVWHITWEQLFRISREQGRRNCRSRACRGFWLAPWCAAQTLRVLHSPNPQLPLHTVPAGSNDTDSGGDEFL